jgi:PTS system nitrogen regulatory IIA component
LHPWLETQIGLSNEDELVRIENAFDDQLRGIDQQPLGIAELLAPEAIAVPLEARTRNSVITSIVDVAARTGWLWDTGAMAQAVRAREDLCPTALETGVALLHPRRPMPQLLDRPLLAFGRTERGIPFGGGSGTLTDLFFLLCSTTDREHLHALARLSRVINSSDFIAALRAAADRDEALQLMIERERELLE